MGKLREAQMFRGDGCIGEKVRPHIRWHDGGSCRCRRPGRTGGAWCAWVHGRYAGESGGGAGVTDDGAPLAVRFSIMRGEVPVEAEPGEAGGEPDVAVGRHCGRVV